jgi:uridine kinase
MSRQEVLQQLAEIIVSIKHSYPLRVAIDGIDAAGKTTLADELAPLIERQGRSVIRASIDGFHRPRQERYRQGRDSPEGYYKDSFDYARLREVLLMPLGPHGTGHYRRAVFDVGADAPLQTKEEVAALNAVLLFDGVFLLRPELEDMWDYRIFVNVDLEGALQRAVQRDLPRLGSQEAVRTHYLQRYFPGQRLYFQAVQPQRCADVAACATISPRPSNSAQE